MPALSLTLPLLRLLKHGPQQQGLWFRTHISRCVTPPKCWDCRISEFSSFWRAEIVLTRPLSPNSRCNWVARVPYRRLVDTCLGTLAG